MIMIPHPPGDAYQLADLLIVVDLVIMKIFEGEKGGLCWT